MSSNVRSRTTQLGAIGFAAVALGCAAFGAYLINNMLNAKGYSGDRVRPVVVAKHALPAAQPFTEADVEVISWPEKHVPPGVVDNVKALFPNGKRPIPSTAILEGEPIVPTRLASSAQGTGLAALVRDGYRAVAVKVDEAVGRSGLVYPGAHVDVIVTIRDPDGRGPSTRIAVSDAKVLAVELETDVETRKVRRPDDDQQQVNKPTVVGTVVTLEVLPADAEIVSLATREGQIDLALRNGADRKPVDTKGAVPVMFSAFAPEITDDPATSRPADIQALAAAQQQKARDDAAKKAATQRPVTPRRKGIELRAVDSPPGPGEHPTGTIETYHAQ